MYKMLNTEEKVKPEADRSEPGGMEGARRATGVPPGPAAPRIDAPDPEVPEAKSRRKFTAAYKLRILKEVDLCSEPGQLGIILRQEGLYYSNLTTWKRQREDGILQGISPKKRGRKKKAINPLSQRVAQLEKENRRLQQKLKRAETIIDAQKKISEILGIDQDLDESWENI
jgi:transposase-like protein